MGGFKMGVEDPILLKSREIIEHTLSRIEQMVEEYGLSEIMDKIKFFLDAVLAEIEEEDLGGINMVALCHENRDIFVAVFRDFLFLYSGDLKEVLEFIESGRNIVARSAKVRGKFATTDMPINPPKWNELIQKFVDMLKKKLSESL